MALTLFSLFNLIMIDPPNREYLNIFPSMNPSLDDDTGIDGEEDALFGKQLKVGTWIPCHQVGTV